MVGGHYSNNKASKQNHHKRGSITESVSSLVCDDSERPNSNYNYRNYHNISAPKPALAPSNLDLSRNPSRSHLIRHDLLSSKSKQNNHNFFLDASDNGADRGISNPHERRVDLNKAPNPPAKSVDQYSQYVPPPIPDSPSRRYSWMSGKSGKTNRTSMESEPPKFRGVNSWVGDQAVRIEEKEMRKPNRTTADAGVKRGDADQMTLASATSVPPTPAEFKHHPGQMVEFLAKEKRVDSRVLDRMDEKHLSR